jgi:hypothetical protein
MSKNKSLIAQVEAVFDRKALARVCAMDEEAFPGHYGMTRTDVSSKWAEDFYAFRDNGSQVLAVAHLDTVQPNYRRAATFCNTAGGEVVYSGALDDRLGAYIILEMLPRLGWKYDWLLTTGEEMGQSTAQWFTTDKQYDWIIEFDRGGCDVVMYQFEDEDTIDAVEESGARAATGIFSDIAYLEHLECKAWNWGTGYRDYHGPRSHAWLDDTFQMVAYFLNFALAQDGFHWPHTKRDRRPWWADDDAYASSSSQYSADDSDGVQYADSDWVNRSNGSGVIEVEDADEPRALGTSWGYCETCDDYFPPENYLDHDHDAIDPVEDRECERLFGPHGTDHDDCPQIVDDLMQT